MGIPMGDSILIIGRIQEQAQSASVHPNQGQSQSQGSAQQQQLVPVKGTGLIAFLELEPTGFPTLRGWDAYKLGFAAHIGPLVSGEGHTLIKSINADPMHKVPSGWKTGGADDVLINERLVNGASGGVGAMPDNLVLLVPEALMAQQAGAAIYSFITMGVKALCDESVTVLQSWFTAPPQISEGNKHMLVAALQEWSSTLHKLNTMQAPQSEVQQRISLEAMVARLKEAKEMIAALKAANKMKAVPVSDYMEVLQALGIKYSSVKQQPQACAAFGAFTVEESQVPPGGDKTPRGTVECRFWKSGRCWRGAKCQWKHTGKPGWCVRRV